ncbi:MAG: MerR family DNA-binding transcriptional regulator [Lachnospira sp.]
MRIIMIYTVGEMAKMLDVPASTLRYYDKEGLLPFVDALRAESVCFRNPTTAG